MVLVAFFVLGASRAATAAEPQVFTDWSLSCRTTGSEGCTLSQTLVRKENATPFLTVAAEHVPDREEPVASLTLPLGVYLPAGVRIRVDAGEARELPFEVCTPKGCNALVALDAALLGAMRRGEKLEVRFFHTDSRPIALELSLRGFSKGMDALEASVVKAPSRAGP